MSQSEKIVGSHLQDQPSSKLNTFAQIRDLSESHSLLFACALMQRMLPNYILFHQVTQFGNPQVMSSALSLLWEHCTLTQTSFNAALQLDKIESNIPEVNDFDSYGVYPAIDFCVALTCAMQSVMGEHPHIGVTAAKLSQGSVEAYILASSENEISNQDIKQHPLMEYEIQTQQFLLSEIKANKISKAWVKSLRTDILTEKVSNLGIEFE